MIAKQINTRFSGEDVSKIDTVKALLKPGLVLTGRRITKLLRSTQICSDSVRCAQMGRDVEM